MLELKRISIENVNAGNFGEEHYELVAMYGSYPDLNRHLLAIINDEREADTENYYYDVRENGI